jgi:hypothetical protein
MNTIYLLLTLMIAISLSLSVRVFTEPFTQTQLYSQNQPDKLPNTEYIKYDVRVDTPQYHSDPSTENNLEFGYVWVQDENGKLRATKLDVIQNKTLYYPFGSATPNPPPFVPSYEESVWLSQKSNPLPRGVHTPAV